MRAVSSGLPARLRRARGRVAPLVLRAARRQAVLTEHTRRLGSDISWVFTRRLSFGDTEVDPAVVDFVDSVISATGIEAIADFYPAVMHHDGRPGLAVLARSSAQVVVIGAEKDVMTPYPHSEAIAVALPQADLVTVAGAGHVVMLERPDVVDDALCDLVADALKRASSTL